MLAGAPEYRVTDRGGWAEPDCADFDGETGAGMTLVVLTVVIIGLLIAALAFYLFMIGGLLRSTAVGLGDCLGSVRTIAGQAQVIGPGVMRINKTGTDLIGAMPLLLEGADGVTAKLAPSAVTTAAPAAGTAASAAAPAASAAAPAALVGSAAADSHSGLTGAQTTRTGGGYMDDDVATGSVGYLDA